MHIFTIMTVHAYSDGIGTGPGRNCDILIDRVHAIDCMREFRDAFEADLQRYNSKGESPISSITYTEFDCDPGRRAQCESVARLSVKFYGEKKEILIKAHRHWRGDLVRGSDE